MCVYVSKSNSGQLYLIKTEAAMNEIHSFLKHYAPTNLSYWITSKEDHILLSELFLKCI